MCMHRNKVRFFFALYKGREPITDNYGNLTGEYKIIHDNPRAFYANISSAKGETNTWHFGENESYDKVIVMDKYSPPINEFTILWVDIIPKMEIDRTLSTNDYGEVITPHDYIVKKISKSFNSISIAISKVNVNG